MYAFRNTSDAFHQRSSSCRPLTECIRRFPEGIHSVFFDGKTGNIFNLIMRMRVAGVPVPASHYILSSLPYHGLSHYTKANILSIVKQKLLTKTRSCWTNSAFCAAKEPVKPNLRRYRYYFYLFKSSSNSPRSLWGFGRTLRRNINWIRQQMKNFSVDPNC